MDSLSRPARLYRLVTSTLVAASLVLPLNATWSIVAVDTATGEVAVASATCLTNFDLQHATPVIVVGRGAGAAQAAVDVSGVNRGIMFDGFRAGWTPRDIFDEIRANGAGSVQSKQFGIVGMEGNPISFSGIQNGDAASGLVGRRGTIIYAIQGNVLAGDAVVTAARDAFIAGEVDLSQRMMAAMEAARAFGGDGRCSCGPDADSCGAPPQNGFTKTAHVGYVLVARIGDTDGVCNSSLGCANGNYYLAVNVVGGALSPDPVFTLQSEYDAWRSNLAGRPDHLRSSALPAVDSLPADGLTATTVVVELVDLEGVPLGFGGADVRVALAEGSPDVALGPVQDRGDGTYAFGVVAGNETGTARFVVTANDGIAKATLFPHAELRIDTIQPVHLGVDDLRAIDGGRLPFVLNDPEAAEAAFILIASGSGTDPGVVIGPHLVPLNFDALTLRSVQRAGEGAFRDSVGRLDASGRAQATLNMPPGVLVNWIGRIDWAAIAFGGALGGSLRVHGPVGFDVAH